MKFKEGNIVTCVDNKGYENQLTNGKDYTVGEGYNDDYTRVTNDFGSALAGYRSYRFIPAKRNTFTIPPGNEAVRDSEGRATGAVRVFSTGATRDTDENKLDFEGFFSPLVMEEFAKYMHGKRKMADGSMRDSDNWQRGIPLDAYMKSMWRHFFAVWKSHRAGTVSREDLMGLMFNVQGFIHETLKNGL